MNLLIESKFENLQVKEPLIYSYSDSSIIYRYTYIILFTLSLNRVHKTMENGKTRLKSRLSGQCATQIDKEYPTYNKCTIIIHTPVSIRA